MTTANVQTSRDPAATPRAVLLGAKGIGKSYGGLRAVGDACLDLYAGEVVALVGDNGAGKSTFVRMLSGVIAPDTGTLAIDGREVRFGSPAQARAAGIETLHQSLALVDVFDVPGNVFLGRELVRRRFGVLPVLDKAAMRRRTAELLQRIGANLPSIDRPVRAMSGGQRQAVAIARLLLNEVRLLIMDEPMAALGVDEGRKVLDLIAELRARGLAVLIISHNLEHVFSVADRICVMKNGGIVGVVEAAGTSHDRIVRMIVSGTA
ncbi:MAG TPA: ATP-binding cassette domain-containing protein [Burkholderiales bacterium]|nr:ATP-binding cassette domain-containing protein [Burkholderiales bacterium]